MDAQTIRVAAFELLHAAEAMSAGAIAEATGADVRAVCAALGSDSGRFARVAGEGAWWWTLATLYGLGQKRHLAPPPSDGAHARAYRQRVAARERVRGALQREPGGITLARIALLTGLTGVEIADQLQSLRALGEAAPFTIPGMAGFEFWKDSAA